MLSLQVALHKTQVTAGAAVGQGSVKVFSGDAEFAGGIT